MIGASDPIPRQPAASADLLQLDGIPTPSNDVESHVITPQKCTPEQSIEDIKQIG